MIVNRDLEAFLYFEADVFLYVEHSGKDSILADILSKPGKISTQLLWKCLRVKRLLDRHRKL